MGRELLDHDEGLLRRHDHVEQPAPPDGYTSGQQSLPNDNASFAANTVDEPYTVAPGSQFRLFRSRVINAPPCSIRSRYQKNRSPELDPGIDFFLLARRMTVDGFYTSPLGMRDLYLGNAPQAQFRVPQQAYDDVLSRSPFK